jgi:hypothetical protein
MWMYVSIPEFQKKDALETFLDELMTLSPEILLGPAQGAYLNLKSVHHFWKLSEFLRNKEENKLQHPFYKTLEKLHLEYGCHFTLAETPAECSWARLHSPFHHDGKSFFFLLQKNDHYHELLSKSPIRELSAWLQDLVESDDKTDTELMLFCDGLEYIGIRTLMELHVALSKRDFLQTALFRFGRLLKHIHDRLRGSEDFHMHPYEPPMHLRVEFYPELEKNMSVEVEGEIPTRVLEILRKWERRLEARKSLLSGLELILETEDSTLDLPSNSSLPHRRPALSPGKKSLRALFPHPLRDPNFIHQIFLEKWMSSSGDSFFDQPIVRVTLRSLGLQRATEHQLHLFDHTDEDVYQEWGLLLGKLHNRSSERGIEVGSFEARESFIPEKSVQFKSWSPGQKFEVITEHPERPQLLEKRPREVLRDLSQDDFMTLLKQRSNLRSLEIISEEEKDERLYGRVQDDWVFYDPSQRKVLKHGAF